MALATTTLSAAVGVSDTAIVVASATGIAAGMGCRLDQEVGQVAQNYVSGTIVPILRGQDGSVTAAHASGANVTFFLGSDESTIGPQTATQWPVAGWARTLTSYSASGAIALPTPGTDAIAILNGTSTLAMTVAAPTKDMDGSFLYVASNGAAAHTVTFTGGLSGAGTSYDVCTINSSAPVCLAVAVAINGKWNSVVAVPLAGTVTNITATVA